MPAGEWPPRGPRCPGPRWRPRRGSIPGAPPQEQAGQGRSPPRPHDGRPRGLRPAFSHRETSRRCGRAPAVRLSRSRVRSRRRNTGGMSMGSMTKVGVVTGGGTGIGRAVALALAGEGYSVVVAGRRKEPLEAVVAEGSKLGARMLGVPTDVSDPKSVRDRFDTTVETFGQLDLLF